MSTVNNGPQIVRNGLVLNLDAGNGKSYSTNRFQALGSGTITENVTFAINGTGTFQRVASGTVIGGYTVRPNDVVYSYVLGVTGCHYHGNVAPIPAGSYATFSVDYLITGATNIATSYPNNVVLVYENYAGSALAGSTGLANNYQDTWQRLTLTAGPTSGTGTQAMFLYPGYCSPGKLAESGTIYFRNPKVEWTNVDTGNSTFSSTSNIGLWYDLSGNGNNGTLTNGPTAGVGTQAMFLYPGFCSPGKLADSGTIYFRNPKVEWTNVDTGNSTFSSTSNIGLWYDLSGNGYNGTLNGPTSNVSNKGNILFNGSSDYVTGIGSSIVPTSTAPYTVSVWCYRNTNNLNSKELLAQWTSANSSNSFFFGFNNSNVRFTDNWNDVVVSGAGNTNVWMNLVGVYTVSNAYIYLNGVLAATKGSGFTYTGTGPLIIGRQGELNGEYFDGRISNVLIYNRALSAAEVSQNYQATKTRFGL